MQTSIEWLIQRHVEQGGILTAQDWIWAKEMHKAEQETLYTEQEIRKAYFRGNNIDYLIQVLKQLKKN